MTSPAAAARSRERIAEICHAGLDARTLRLRLLEAIGEVVGFSAYAWLLTDPATSVGSAPLADVPCLPELPNLIRLKYLTPVNRWTALDRPPFATLRGTTGGDLSGSLLWRDLLRRYDVIDLASIVFRDRLGCWGFLDLWRDSTGVAFSAAEAAFLAGITQPVTAALRRSQADTFTGARPLGDRPGPVVLLLSHDLRVLRQTPQTEDYLHVLVPPAPDRAAIPASAYNVAAQLLAVEAGVDANPPSARVHLADGVWLTLRAARIGDDRPTPVSDIAVTIEQTSPAERLPLFAAAFALTAREGELLGHLATGADTRETADRLVLSEHTVQDHLKAIFAKTGVHSRRALLTRALGM